MSKHTPGPWKTRAGFAVSTEMGHFVAQVFKQDRAGKFDLAETTSNARLIATAPEMYEIMKAFAETTVRPEYAHWQHQFRSIVAKIDGD